MKFENVYIEKDYTAKDGMKYRKGTVGLIGGDKLKELKKNKVIRTTARKVGDTTEDRIIKKSRKTKTKES